MTYTLTQRTTETGPQYAVTDESGRLVGMRTGSRVLRGAVIVRTDFSDGPTVWSWHATQAGATAAANKLHRAHPEMLVAAATA